MICITHLKKSPNSPLIKYLLYLNWCEIYKKNERIFFVAKKFCIYLQNKVLKYVLIRTFLKLRAAKQTFSGVRHS
ncbi:MAG: hypothetical protein EAZ57_09075 [Cytophagales bacterium]|nr:MAG: hypothetical protein EAZ67_09885 [Cytophagales bacterium]TAF60048.1 MAG: hypothetical protein EAZ57_09075 [Cytophagales bacterium]